MLEFATVSASSYDPSALAAKLNEKSAEGWSVVSIVSTGGDITAFLSRGATADAPAEGAAAEPVVSVVEPVAEPVAESVAPEPQDAAAEPAGWALAPEPAAQPQPAAQPEPQPAPAPAPEPTPAPAPVAAAPATPAVPSGWYADPSGRYELRYWDGAAWTEHVARAGQQFTDPPVA